MTNWEGGVTKEYFRDGRDDRIVCPARLAFGRGVDLSHVASVSAIRDIVRGVLKEASEGAERRQKLEEAATALRLVRHLGCDVRGFVLDVSYQ